MIKAIIFDIGGVIVPDLTKKVMGLAKNKNFTKNIHKYSNYLDSGKITLSKLEKIFNKKYEVNLDFRKMYLDSAKKSKINKNILKLILKLRKNYKVIYLSNTFKEHYLIRKKQHVYDNFLFGISSYKVKLRKPYRIIYKLTLRKLKLGPEECIFIDDREDNIKTAKRLKINTILFKNNKQLIKNLKKFNINI